MMISKLRQKVRIRSDVDIKMILKRIKNLQAESIKSRETDKNEENSEKHLNLRREKEKQSFLDIPQALRDFSLVKTDGHRAWRHICDQIAESDEEQIVQVVIICPFQLVHSLVNSINLY